MKRLRFPLRASLALKVLLPKALLPKVLLLLLAGAQFHRARAQNLPAIEVAPQVLDATGQITLTLPATATLSSNRMRIGLFEHGRNARLAEVQRELRVENGTRRATLTVQAAPGFYDVRLLGRDKARAPLSQPATILVPGIDREPGWWLLNGTPFFSSGAETQAPANAPFFIAGLKRDFNRKSKNSSADIVVPSSAPLQWNVLRVTAPSPDFDWNAWRGEVQRTVNEAQQRGERGFAGVAFSAPSESTLSAAALARVRDTLRGLAPDAALILEINGSDAAQTARDIEAFGAAQWDAVLLRMAHAWPVKVARRIAEEQPQFDLPIFVDASGASNDAMQLDLFMAGATGFVLGAAPRAFEWARIITRNASLFVGSVTIEDIGLLPSHERDFVALYDTLRAAGRIPLLARAGVFKERKERESLMMALDESLTRPDLEALRATASAGARLYLEGVPSLDDATLRAQFELLVGATLKTTDAKSTFMTLDDAWTFGSARGARVAVRQSVVVTMQDSAAQAARKEKKGVDVLTEPRIVARLEDNSPAVIVLPVGEGEIAWAPHKVLSPKVLLDSNAARDYYTAMAAYVQPGLVEIRAVAEKSSEESGAGNVRAALRRSAKGTLILALINDAAQPASVTAALQTGARVAVDLGDDTELPLSARGFRAEVPVTIAPRGWKLIAFGESRRELDDERFAPRVKARLR